jgi:hypothetical protein
VLALSTDRLVFHRQRAYRCTATNWRFGPILLQKSKVAGPRIFRENMKRKAITDSYNLNRFAEVACEFNVRRRGPSHLYTKAAPAARRIFDQTTFATKSLGSGHSVHTARAVTRLDAEFLDERPPFRGIGLDKRCRQPSRPRC